MKINKLTLNERKNDILSYFGEINAPCRTSEVAEHLGVSAYQARHYLQCLEKEGKIKRSPVRRGAQYAVGNQQYSAITRQDRCRCGQKAVPENILPL